MKRLLLYAPILLCLIAYAFVAEARTKAVVSPVIPLNLECLKDASQHYNVPLAALLGILSVEGGRVGEALRNTNGTWDMGAFQINTCHSNALADMGISPKSVLTDGCVNARVAAWILRKEYVRTGNIWQAIGAYHSRTPHRGNAYKEKVRSHIVRLQMHGVTSLLRLHMGDTQ